MLVPTDGFFCVFFKGVTAGINMVDDIQDWPEDVVQQMSSL